MIMKLTLELDENTYERLEDRAKRQGFDSTEAYGVMILQTVIDELEESGEEDSVRDRLEDLGYL